MARKSKSDKILAVVEKTLGSLPQSKGRETCATCRTLPDQASYYEKCRGVELERSGEMPRGKDSLTELLMFDEWRVLLCPACSTIYLYSRDYDSHSGHGWELSESLERTDAGRVRSLIVHLLESRPRMQLAAPGH